MPQAPAAPTQDKIVTMTGDDDAPKGSPSWLIAKARELEKQRAAILEKVGANRESLRNLDKQDALSEDEGEWLDVFYPERGDSDEPRSKEENERTRKAREHARKH